MEGEELEKVMEIYKKHDVYVISDEIWSDLILGDYKHIPTQSVSEDARNRTVAVYAPSKTFNLAGMQTSNIFIPDASKRSSFIAEMDKVSVGMVSPMGMAACEAAYRYGENWLEELKSYLEGNRKFIEEFLKKEIPDVSLPSITLLILGIQ